MEELHYNYARYLMISSSRSTTMPATLQGKWNQSMAKNMYRVTPKSYHFENGKIIFTDSAEDKDDVFIMHTKEAIMGTTDLTGDGNIRSAGNLAWLMYNVWDIYLTSGDKKLLAEEVYPIMRKAANFYNNIS